MYIQEPKKKESTHNGLQHVSPIQSENVNLNSGIHLERG